MTVEAVLGEVKGDEPGVPVVSLLPHMTPMFCCGATACAKEILSKVEASAKWSQTLDFACSKLDGNRCDFCFKLADKVHR